MSINWEKTKIMFLTKAKVNLPESVNICGSNVEVVSEFKLLGICIDKSLTFCKYVDSLKKSVNTKLYSISKIFYLSYSIKIQFFKTFIQTYFNYCSSLSIYFSPTLTSQIERLFNNCIHKLLKIKLHDKSIEEQYSFLKPLNIFPYRLRIFFNLCTFSHKILNNKILQNIKKTLETCSVNYDLRDKRILFEPKSRTKSGAKCLTIFLSKFVNKTLRHSYLLSFSDFKYFISNQIILLYKKFPLNFNLIV